MPTVIAKLIQLNSLCLSTTVLATSANVERVVLFATLLQLSEADLKLQVHTVMLRHKLLSCTSLTMTFGMQCQTTHSSRLGAPSCCRTMPTMIRFWFNAVCWCAIVFYHVRKLNVGLYSNAGGCWCGGVWYSRNLILMWYYYDCKIYLIKLLIKTF